MKPLALLLLLSCAGSEAVFPAERRTLPARERHTLTLTPDGKYWRHTVTYPSGRSEVRVFPVVPFRISPSTKQP